MRTSFLVSFAAFTAAVWLGALHAQERKPDDHAAKQATPPATASAQDDTAKPAEHKEAGLATMFRSKDILGLEVRNKEGKDLGDVKDLVVELGSGDIRYAALSHGGFAGLGTKLFAVPWDALTFKFGENDHFFILDATEEQLKQAKGFDDDNWPNVADPMFASKSTKHDADKQDANKDENIENAAAEERKREEGRETVQAGDKKVTDQIVYDTVYRLGTIKGMEVRDNAGRDIGSVNDVVLDLKEGKARYNVVSSGGIAGIGGKYFAVPFGHFKLQHAENEKFFALNASHESLRDAPTFEGNRWPNFNDPQFASDIDRHYGEVRTAERPTPRKD